jgi:DNA anti-recombination protein RmuC
MSYDQYALLDQSTQNSACKVHGALITIREESQESFTQMQHEVKTQITNVVAMQQQTEMLAEQVDHEIEMLRK